MSDQYQVLVTGANGFIGSAVFTRLRMESLFNPVGTVRVRGNRTCNEADLVPMAEIGPDTDWSALLQDVHMVVHTVARTHVRDVKSTESLNAYRTVNVDGTINLARQAAREGVKRFIFLSSVKVNGEATTDEPFTVRHDPLPEDSYAISKYEAEQELMNLASKTDMEVVIIRPPLVYGPGIKGNFASMLRWVNQGVPLPLGAVMDNRRSLVALDNLVDLIVTCMNHPAATNQVFLAGDGEDVSTADLLRRIGHAMNKPVYLVPVPVWMLKVGAALLGKQEQAQRLLGSLQVDISKTRELLGWTPPLSLDEGLRRAVESFMATGK